MCRRKGPRTSTWHLYQRWPSNKKSILKDRYCYFYIKESAPGLYSNHGSTPVCLYIPRRWLRASIQIKVLTTGMHPNQGVGIGHPVLCTSRSRCNTGQVFSTVLTKHRNYEPNTKSTSCFNIV
ncbi:hypothetical protein BsWGS_08375 [Bradybaena similaris]